MSCSDYIVLNGRDIIVDKEVIFGKEKRGTKDEYKKYLEDVQELISEFEKNKEVKFPETHSLHEALSIEFIEKKNRIVDFICNFFGAKAIIVQKVGCKYKVIDNGYHRAKIALENNLKIIAKVNYI